MTADDIINSHIESLQLELGKAEVEVSREALAHLLTIYELAQASLFADGEIAPGGEFYDRLVDAVDDERNVEWGIGIRAALAQEDTNG